MNLVLFIDILLMLSEFSCIFLCIDEVIRILSYYFNLECPTCNREVNNGLIIFFFILLFYNTPFLFFSFIFLSSYLTRFIWGGWSGISFYRSNWLSFNLIIISIFLLCLIFLSEININLIFFSMLTVFFSIVFFMCQNLLLFFISFELVSLPIVMIIYYYGSQPEKLSSLYFMLLYTGSLALPFFYIIMVMDVWSFYVSSLLSFFMIGLFLVKSPLYIFHFWLPKAHVEAPTTARILLAGLLLKVGLYGFLKVTVRLGISYMWIFLFSLLGYLIGPFLSFFSSETKQLSAYSSVTHINIVLNVILFFSLYLNTSSYVISLSHGYISSLIFYIVGEMYHSRGTRMIYFSTRVSSCSGFMIFCYRLVLLSNAGVPFNLSFWGELMLVTSLLRLEILFLFFVFIYFILSFYYSVFLILHMMKYEFVSHYNNYSILVVFLGIFPLLFILIFIF